MANRYGIDTDNWKQNETVPFSSGRGREANALNSAMAAYHAVRGFQGEQADNEAADARTAAGQQQEQQTDTTAIDKSQYEQVPGDETTGGLQYRLKPDAAAAVEASGDYVSNGGVVDPTYKRQYGLGASPKAWRDTEYSPDEKRVAGMQATADYWAGSKTVGAAGKAKEARLDLRDEENYGLQRKLTQAKVDALPDEAEERRLGLAGKRREGIKAVKAEELDGELVSAVEKMQLMRPDSPEYKSAQTALKQQFVTKLGGVAGLKEYENYASQLDTRRNSEIKQRAQATFEASVSEAAAIEHYGKNLRDGFTAEVAVDPKTGMRQIMRVSEDGAKTPMPGAKPYKSWEEGGQEQMLAAIPEFAKVAWELDKKHAHKLVETKAAGDEHVRYAKAITDGRAALASGKPNKDQPIGMTDMGEIIVSDGKGGYNTKPITINGKPATPEQIKTFKKLNASTGLADSDPIVEIETEKDGKKMKMKVPLSIADPAQFRAFDVARRSKAEKPGGAMAAYTPDQPGKEEKPRVGLPTRAQNNAGISNYGALTSWDTIIGGLGSRDPGAMNYIENRLRSPYGGSSVPVDALEQAAAAGSALAFEELGLRRQRREEP